MEEEMCPNCGEEFLKFDYKFGRYWCPKCHWESPEDAFA